MIKILLLTLFLFSCKSQEKIAARKAAKEEAARQEHMKLLQEVRDKLPCVPVTIIKGVTTYLPGEVIPCPPVDSAGNTGSVQCPDQEVRVDTLKVADESALWAVRDSLEASDYRWIQLLNEYNKEAANADKVEAELKEEKKDRNWWRSRAIATWSILGLLAGGAIFSKIKGII